MAVTVYGLGSIGLRVRNYFAYVKPELSAIREKVDLELLEEGKPKDLLSDTAPNIRG